MGSAVGFRFVQGVYWLFLGTWFGAIVMLVVSAAIIFKTVRGYEPTIQAAPYNEFPDKAADILAGGTVGQILAGLAVIQLVCAATVLLCAVVQSTVFADRVVGGVTGWLNVLRIALLLGPMVILAADQLLITPRLGQHRQIMYDAKQPESARAAARQQFDHLHELDERVVGLAAIMLLAAIFAS